MEIRLLHENERLVFWILKNLNDVLFILYRSYKVIICCDLNKENSIKRPNFSELLLFFIIRNFILFTFRHFKPVLFGWICLCKYTDERTCGSHTLKFSEIKSFTFHGLLSRFKSILKWSYLYAILFFYIVVFRKSDVFTKSNLLILFWSVIINLYWLNTL